MVRRVTVTPRDTASSARVASSHTSCAVWRHGSKATESSCAAGRRNCRSISCTTSEAETSKGGGGGCEGGSSCSAPNSGTPPAMEREVASSTLASCSVSVNAAFAAAVSDPLSEATVSVRKTSISRRLASSKCGVALAMRTRATSIPSRSAKCDCTIDRKLARRFVPEAPYWAGSMSVKLKTRRWGSALFERSRRSPNATLTPSTWSSRPPTTARAHTPGMREAGGSSRLIHRAGSSETANSASKSPLTS